MAPIEILPGPEEVARAAAERVAAALAAGAARLVLAGGSTPRRCYRLLAGMDVQWGRVTVLFGDERCLAPDDPESNYRMARESLLDLVAPATVHRIPGELGPEAAAAAYERVLRAVGSLDLVLLGMGPDGHTASLFPGHPALRAAGLVAGVEDSPKPPPGRVTLTLAALRQARRVLFLVTGQDKALALERARRGEVPAGMVPGAEWLVDRGAAGAR